MTDLDEFDKLLGMIASNADEQQQQRKDACLEYPLYLLVEWVDEDNNIEDDCVGCIAIGSTVIPYDREDNPVVKSIRDYMIEKVEAIGYNAANGARFLGDAWRSRAVTVLRGMGAIPDSVDTIDLTGDECDNIFVKYNDYTHQYIHALLINDISEAQKLKEMLIPVLEVIQHIVRYGLTKIDKSDPSRAQLIRVLLNLCKVIPSIDIVPDFINGKTVITTDVTTLINNFNERRTTTAGE